MTCWARPRQQKNGLRGQGRIDDEDSQAALDLLGAPETRKKMALKGQALIDGEGADRVDVCSE